MTAPECLEAAHDWMLEYKRKKSIPDDDLAWAEIMGVLAMARQELGR